MYAMYLSLKYISVTLINSVTKYCFTMTCDFTKASDLRPFDIFSKLPQNGILNEIYFTLNYFKYFPKGPWNISTDVFPLSIDVFSPYNERNELIRLI